MSEQLWPDRLRRLSRPRAREYFGRALRRVDAVLAQVGERRVTVRYAFRDARQRLGDGFAALTVPFALALEWTRRTLHLGWGLVALQLGRVHVPYSDRIPRMNPRTRRISTWVGAFAVLGVVEVALALPLLTGVSREAARSVQAAAQVVANHTVRDERRAAPALDDKAAGREGFDAAPPAGNGPGNRGTPAFLASEENEGDVEEYSPRDTSSDSSSASQRPDGSGTDDAASKAGGSGSRGDTPRSAPRRQTPQAPELAPPPPPPPAPTPPVADPPPPPLPPPSTTIVTRTTISTSPPHPPPAPPTTTTAKSPPPPPTTTTAASSPQPPPTTTTPGDSTCKGKRCRDDDDDEDEDEDD